MQVTLLPYGLHVLSVPAAQVPRMAYPLVRLLVHAAGEDRFLSLSKTATELSLVLDEGLFRQLEADVDLLQLDARPYKCWPQRWVAMQVDQGASVSDDEEAVVFSLSEPMASENISIYYLSTFDADYCLVQEGQLRRAVAVLRAHHSVILEGEAFFADKPLAEGGANGDQGCSCENLPSVQLRLLDCSLSLAKLPPATLPLLAATLLDLFLTGPAQVLSYTEVDCEASLVLCEEAMRRLPEGVAEDVNLYSAAWTALAVIGPLGYAECGIVRTISEPLLKGGLEIFYLSTFSTDLCLVHHERADDARSALEQGSIGVTT